MRLIFLIFTLLPVISFAGIKAVTDSGDIVILNDNGTWVYESKVALKKEEIKRNKNKFEKNSQAVFEIKSEKNSSRFWINPARWNFEKGDPGGETEYQFRLKGEDLYGMAITEKVQVEMENLLDLAVENARTVAPDIRVISKEYRRVNGVTLLHMKMEGTIQSINFIYYGYYYSDDTGSTQYLAYTAKNLAPAYEKDIYKFLNGFASEI